MCVFVCGERVDGKYAPNSCDCVKLPSLFDIYLDRVALFHSNGAFCMENLELKPLLVVQYHHSKPSSAH